MNGYTAKKLIEFGYLIREIDQFNFILMEGRNLEYNMEFCKHFDWLAKNVIKIVQERDKLKTRVKELERQLELISRH